MKTFFSWIALIGADPNDDDDIKLQESLLIASTLPFAFAGIA